MSWSQSSQATNGITKGEEIIMALQKENDALMTKL